MKRLLGLVIVAAMPAAANVGRVQPLPPPPRELIAAIEASPQALRRALRFERLSQILEGVTVVDFESALETGKVARRLVLKPDFQGGPGAALSVRF